MHVYWGIGQVRGGGGQRRTEACDGHCHELSDFVEGFGIVDEVGITQSTLHCVQVFLQVTAGWWWWGVFVWRNYLGLRHSLTDPLTLTMYNETEEFIRLLVYIPMCIYTT